MTQPPDDDDALLKVPQAAAKLGISRRKLMELIASGDVVTIRIPSKNGISRGEHRIEPGEIQRVKDLWRQPATA